MAQEVGVAYVTLLPSARGFGKAVENELDGAADGHEQKQKSLWSKVTKYGAIAATAIGALFTGKILTGGLSRALNIEDAQAKLNGLGHDTETVTGIMQNALAAVKGTAFGLDQAATIAASAVAAGVKPGQELERYLRLTADAATIAGVSLDELGSVMNNVTTLGAAYNDSLQILAQKGIPIYQWLADELGVTTDAVKQLASEGKISAQTFQAAIENNIAGAALAGGETTRGAFANMQAAMSRWGANLLSGVLPFAKTFFNEMIIIFDGLNERSAPFIEKFNKWLGGINVDGFGQRFLDWIDRLDFTPLVETYKALKPVIDVIQSISPLVWKTLGDALVQVGQALVPELPKIASALAGALVEIAPKIPEVVDALAPLIPILADLIVLLAPVVTALLGWAAGLITMTTDQEGYTGSWGDLLATLLGFGGIPKLFDAIFAALGTTPKEFFDGLGNTFNIGLGNVVGMVNTFGVQLVDAVSRAWGGVQNTFATGLAYIQTIPNRIVAFFASLPGQMDTIGRQIVQGLINGISAMVGNAVRSVTTLSASMVTGMKNILGIRSPSRVFRDEIGAQIVAGLVVGIDNNRPSATDAVQSLVTVPKVDAAAAPVIVAKSKGGIDLLKYIEFSIEEHSDGVALQVQGGAA